MFHTFSQPIHDILLPDKFTFPFYYQPHQLAEIAAKSLQAQLKEHRDKGRMYGVLVVQNSQGDLGYLAACSGSFTDEFGKEQQQDIFVPSLFTGFGEDSFYSQQTAKVNRINAELSVLEKAPQRHYLQQLVNSEQQAAQFQIAREQKINADKRELRKQKRADLAPLLSDEAKNNNPDDFVRATQSSIQLSRESVADKKALIALKDYWQQRIEHAQHQLTPLEKSINALKKTRRKLSNKLQNLLFEQYQFLNITGDTKGLIDIFSQEAFGKPPAGAGECAAPKLLQYAFANQLKPICMAEFWWGPAAKSEIRKHGQYYPACQGKCQPILGHMLMGMELDENPLLVAPKPLGELKIVYQDDHIVVVNKPAEMLSVPGKHIEDSVFSRVREQFPDAKGNLILHRLDMATSGLLVLALTPRAHKKLQHQFIDKEIDKRYIAIVEGLIEEDSGRIELPLKTDILDRPRQMVCFREGKPAITEWQVLSRENDTTKLSLNPVTGRTHQLRVHCAHPDGLNSPIIGDGLYGNQANRLHLQAKYLKFNHPITKEVMEFTLPDDF